VSTPTGLVSVGNAIKDGKQGWFVWQFVPLSRTYADLTACRIEYQLLHMISSASASTAMHDYLSWPVNAG
jgi:hypothetical protein